MLIQKTRPICHIDATGNVCKKIENQKIPYFYTLSLYDSENKSIIPLADFVTTSQTTLSVSTFLNQIRFYLQKYYSLCNQKFKPSFEDPPIMVMDRSMVLLNSTLEVFNHITYQDLLKITYACLVKGDFTNFNKIKTFPYWDSIHLMRSFIKKSKKIRHFQKEFEAMACKFSVFCFCLLQTTTSIEDFQRIFLDIYNVFNQQNKNASFLDSIINIEHQIKNRNVHPNINLDTTICDNDRERFKLDLEKEEKKSFTRSQLKNISNSSPFKIHFDKLIKKNCKKVPFDNSIENNFFYNPALFNVIKQFLPSIPLWTGCFLSLLEEKNEHLKACKLELKRLHNNPAEGNFNILKNKIVLKSGAMPSEIASLSYERLLFKFERDYSKRLHEISPNLTKMTNSEETTILGTLDLVGKKRKQIKDFFENEYHEKWGPQKKHRKYTTSYFYGNKSNISYLDLALGIEVDHNKDFSEVFSGKNNILLKRDTVLPRMNQKFKS